MTLGQKWGQAGPTGGRVCDPRSEVGGQAGPTGGRVCELRKVGVLHPVGVSGA